MKSSHGICCFHQFLRFLTQSRFNLQVFLKVIHPRLVVEVQLVVKMVYAELIILPEFRGIFSRHKRYGLPFRHQLLHRLKILICLLGRSRFSLDFLYNFQLSLQIFLFFLLLFSCQLSSFIAYFFVDLLKGALVGIRCRHKVVSLSAISHKLLACSHNFSVAQAIIRLLKPFQLGALHVLRIFAQRFQPLNHLQLTGGRILLLLLFRFFFRRNDCLFACCFYCFRSCFHDCSIVGIRSAGCCFGCINRLRLLGCGEFIFVHFRCFS